MTIRHTNLQYLNRFPATIFGLWTKTTERVRASAKKTEAGMMERTMRSNFCVKSRSPRQPETLGPKSSSLRHSVELMVPIVALSTRDGRCHVDRHRSIGGRRDVYLIGQFVRHTRATNGEVNWLYPKGEQGTCDWPNRPGESKVPRAVSLFRVRWPTGR